MRWREHASERYKSGRMLAAEINTQCTTVQVLPDSSTTQTLIGYRKVACEFESAKMAIIPGIDADFVDGEAAHIPGYSVWTGV